ncbi:MAG: rhamnulokinase [Verrucomicrobia bacterium]|nr:rhamnulokinase [Verrucomicrobiota bacterium]
MNQKVYLGVDLGAESGRVIAGLWDGEKLTLEEIHRFGNGPVLLGNSIRWNVMGLWNEIQTGMSLAAKKFGDSIVSIGADTWGVDFVLLNKDEEVLGMPYHYRDARTNNIMEEVFKIVPKADIFADTGLQFMQFNSLYQLYAWEKHSPSILNAATTFLMMPDFLHWCMCGSKVVEFTNSTTTQFVNAIKRDWSKDLLAKLGIPSHFLPQIVKPGTCLGDLRQALAEKTGLKNVKVVVPPTHDTGAAVAAIPTRRTGSANWAYLSSGTWSLMGAEIQKASLTPQTLAYNMTNEGGVDDTYRLLKNIMGMWLIQQCKKSFENQGKKYSYAELEQMATKATPLRSIVDPDDSRFLNPTDMPKAMQEYCRETNQPVPETEGELMRCARESLALKYRETMLALNELTGEKIEVLHIVGGGSKDVLLNQMTADLCGVPVMTGPVEGTVIGNLLTQARADGELAGLSELREAVRSSSVIRTFEPEKSSKWEAGIAKFEELKKLRK